MKRILLPNGKFAPVKEAKKHSLPVQKVEKKIDKKEEEEPSNEGSAPKSFTLNGEETAAELKAMLDEVGVKYAKNAGKDKCMELIQPYLDEEEVSDEDSL